ncbi:hypothetical protein [Enterobacter hormaechei]|nr:hypothetical protein [Enterobacter hormaechei]
MREKTQPARLAFFLWQRVRAMFLQTRLHLGAVQAISLALRLSKHLLYGLLVRLPACGWHILREIFFWSWYFSFNIRWTEAGIPFWL